MENIKHLYNPTNTLEIIKKYGFGFQKRFGQNFLIDGNVVEKIVREAGITKDDFVLEIGPGIGTMTQILCENAREVAAVEIDKNLIPILAETLAPYDNVTVINEDILKVDVRKLAEEKNGGRPIKVVANLPYYITTPIIMGLFESHVPLESITIMVQKEVAQRMQVGPGTKDYGALSLAVQFYADAQIVLKVPASCFMPRPNVDSAVIKLVRHEDAPVKVKDEQFMFRVIRAAFNQRRKTLANSLANSSELNGSGHACTREDVTTALEAMGLPAGIRGEALTLAQFGELADRLIEMH
ncbi:MAG: 16S rRNA (adenine(1518)-N(6)/adenine(1519)-N(6))-dimethyltransferase RsmA [Clostridia bacterium]|nr:16S rRNA (adenine(1518)-N(6)/adenine(1519)-N(6))-dimethyltransferase RsmA [[Bacteroides] pectinophilus]MDD5873299.1 16S rRNA (adenine(1518)-N(6)/adenine(1519)-N(6))-dimethyltransferase RsmA [Clostridia bacterium]